MVIFETFIFFSIKFQVIFYTLIFFYLPILKTTAVNDAILLQKYLENLCQESRLFLNIEKCQIISFSRKKDNIIFVTIEMGFYRTEFVKDLGIYTASKLFFEIHVDTIVSETWKMLGFTIRFVKNYNP